MLSKSSLTWKCGCWHKDGRLAHGGGWAILHKPFALSGPQLPSLQHEQKQPSLLVCCEQLGEQNVPLASEQSEGGGPARSCCFTKKSRYAKSLTCPPLPLHTPYLDSALSAGGVAPSQGHRVSPGGVGGARGMLGAAAAASRCLLYAGGRGLCALRCVAGRAFSRNRGKVGSGLSQRLHLLARHPEVGAPLAWPVGTAAWFQGLQLEREACLASNYALAKENLALRPRLEMGRTALAIKYQELREVAESCADKLQRLEESMHRWSPHCALGWLQAELEEAEQEAEEQMEQLLLGEQSLEAFLPAFQRGRALAHLRRTQAEKLQELLRAVLPTGAARGPPAVPRSLPPLDSRPVPPLKGSPGCPLGPAPLLSPRPSQPEPPHR
nr:PREDICTED: vacuolar protein sorting-associated protein 37D [Bos mutus]